MAAAVLPLVGILPTIGDGVIRAADGPLHVHRIFAMTTLLQHGQLWPRWIPWFHLGYGYPVFNFYPPGTFYLGGLLGILGISAPVAFTLLAALAWVLGSLGTYGLARRFLPGSAALLAAMLWSYAPSRLYEVWHQGSLPQMMAAALVPWVLWGLVRVAQQPTRRNAVWLGLALAGMTFSHQPITLIAALFVAPATVILPLWYGRREGQTVRRLIYTFGGLMLGGGLTAIFLLPLAMELKYVLSARQAPDVIPYLISNFLQPSQLFTQPLPMDLTDLRFELPETLGLVGGIFSLLGLLALIRRKYFAVLLILGGALAFSVFMLLRPSLPLWETIPFMAQLRFPSRLLRVGALFIALAGGAALLWIPEHWRGAALGGGLTIALIAALPLVYPNQRFVNWPNLSALDEVRMEEVEWNWGTTSYDEFNPIWGEQPGWDAAIEPETYITDPMRVFVNRLDMIRQYPDLQVEELGGMNYRITVATERMVRFRQFYYPGWTATLNGQPVEIYPEDEIGQIAMDVPAGEHTISLAYTGTPVQAVGALITVVSLLVAIGLVVVNPAWCRGVRAGRPYTTEQQPTIEENDALPHRIGYGVVAGIVAFALLNTLVITPNTLLFRYKSPADSPAYMQTAVHQSFGGVFELLGYTLDQDSVAPGELLTVELFWRAEQPLNGEYRPVIQLVNLPITEAWGAVEPFFPGGGKTSTTAYPLDRFASEVHSFPIFETAPPYVGRISVQMLDASTNQPLPLPDGSNRLLLPPLIRITGNGEEIPQKLDYRFNDAIQLRCASVTHDDQQFTIDLGWHVLASMAQDVTLFVHGYDANGEQIAQNDATPLANAYPSSLWLPGQNLRDQHTLPYDPAIVQIGIGLYTPDGRLSLTENGQPIADNRVLLNLEDNTCGG
ncbi:MAG: hypothetical protein K8L97_01135 [Anaerolineae bacterium]|nr:hypothetical protein [Anaerolineae bacterium]